MGASSMNVPVRTKTGPINTAMLLSIVAVAATWLTWPSPESYWQQYILCGLLGSISAAGLLKTAGLLLTDYRLRRNLALSQIVTEDHGSAREATWEEIVARGMDDPSSGRFMGLHRNGLPVFTPPRTPFTLTEMAPGVGKTIFEVIGSILHLAQLGYSLVIPDVKLELAPMLAAALRALGFEVWCVNPNKDFPDLCGDVELNPYQSVLDACYAEGPARKDTIKTAQDLAEIHLPEEGEERNKYFRNGSRRCNAVAILIQALIDPGRCTPTDVFALLNDPARFIKKLLWIRDHLESTIKDDPIVDFLKTEAANLLHRHAKNEENFASFLEGATQVLLSFNQGGRLAYYGREAISSVSDLRKRQIILFILSPLTHTRDFSAFVSMLNYNVLAACKGNPAGHSVHIVGEEALNYRFADVADLETMRGLKTSADFYIQSFFGLVRKVGKDAAASVEAYCDVKIYAGISSYDRAKHVSDMLSEATIRKQDYSSTDVMNDLNVSSRELGRRLMTPDEVLAMPRDQAWVFVQGMRPMKLTMVHYGQVEPWRDQVGDNPVEGSPLRGDPLFRIHYPERKDL